MARGAKELSVSSKTIQQRHLSRHGIEFTPMSNPLRPGQDLRFSPVWTTYPSATYRKPFKYSSVVPPPRQRLYLRTSGRLRQPISTSSCLLILRRSSQRVVLTQGQDPLDRVPWIVWHPRNLGLRSIGPPTAHEEMSRSSSEYLKASVGITTYPYRPSYPPIGRRSPSRDS